MHYYPQGYTRDACLRDYYVVLADDCTAARDEEAHRAAIARLEANFGAVTIADAIESALRNRSPIRGGRL